MTPGKNVPFKFQTPASQPPSLPPFEEASPPLPAVFPLTVSPFLSVPAVRCLLAIHTQRLTLQLHYTLSYQVHLIEPVSCASLRTTQTENLSFDCINKKSYSPSFKASRAHVKAEYVVKLLGKDVQKFRLNRYSPRTFNSSLSYIVDIMKRNWVPQC